METGSDILFFWVARMVMMCQYFTGSFPFKAVLLHPMVRDASGAKMSKSLGNVIDPIEVIEGRSPEQLIHNLENMTLSEAELKKWKILFSYSEENRATRRVKSETPNGIPECGTDALRFSLCVYMEQDRQINLDLARVEGYRRFCNKIWQAVKFYLLAADTMPSDSSFVDSFDAWTLTRFKDTLELVNSALENNDLATSSSALYSFFLYDFCDVYIEVCKPRLASEVHKV